ncbi:MAG TPA: DNA polymerase III subunit delta [Longimicrobiales bacterium]
MARVTREAIARRIAQGQGGGIYYLYGDEEQQKEEAAQAIVDAHLDPATRDFNYDQLDGRTLEPETLASVLQTPPMMADWRVVVVRDAHELAKAARTRDVIEALLDAPPPGLALLLLATVPAKSTAKFYKRLASEAKAMEFAPLSENDLPGWILERATEDGHAIEPDAARALAAAIGSNLGAITQELIKLRELAAGATITVAHVEQAVGRIARVNRWAWFDAVADADFRRARAELPDLLESGENGVGLVIGIATQLLRIQVAVTGGKEALEAALPPHQKWLSRRVMGQTRRWPAGPLQAALRDLLRADRLLKSAGLDDRLVIDELLLRMEARIRAAAA